GFVFFNHFSWIDPVVLMAATPVRYLAASGVRKLPFIGWVGRAVGTVFVNRGDNSSREAARGGLRDAIASSLTPVALAPEGGIKPGPPVRPFRYGAFEVAADTNQPILLVALTYTPWPRAAWQDGETLIDAAWRVSARRGSFAACVTPLDQVSSSIDTVDSDARAAETALNSALATPSSW
ncbi:MAG: 1-acyl-sn-glycerol-3-phosphate acyltransferase, partial [Bacteroidota bacterium]